MAQIPTQPNRTHVDIRRDVAAEYAQQIINLAKNEGLDTTDLYTDKIEQIMLFSEKRGVTAAAEFLRAYANHLAKGYARGVANHVMQSIKALVGWMNNTPNFITQAEQTELRQNDPGALEATDPKTTEKAERRFFGQQQAAQIAVAHAVAGIENGTLVKG